MCCACPLLLAGTGTGGGAGGICPRHIVFGFGMSSRCNCIGGSTVCGGDDDPDDVKLFMRITSSDKRLMEGAATVVASQQRIRSKIWSILKISPPARHLFHMSGLDVATIPSTCLFLLDCV